MTSVYCTPSPKRAGQAKKEGTIPVLLYEVGSTSLAGIGHPIIDECRVLTRPPTTRSWDFLSFALGVTAADSFVKRADAADGWTREIALTVELLDPEPWNANRTNIESTLRFLTGDIWSVNFVSGGSPVLILKRKRWKDAGCDSVCLFSGGLDSFIGAIDAEAEGRRPYLVSCAYPKDAEKQSALVQGLGITRNRHFPGNPDPRWDKQNETSMRGRSFLFLALGTLIASTLKNQTSNPIELLLPENGFISLNVPLTPRRLGSLSTRTTHPHFLAGIDDMLSAVGLNVKVVNPYQFATKGEMMAGCKNPDVLATLAASTVSCGKWKRLTQQCGRCLPCLIRRAAFLRAQIADTTDYRFPELAQADDPEDILAVQQASLTLSSSPENASRRSGPLPLEATVRNEFIDVFRRGLKEVDTFLTGALS